MKKYISYLICIVIALVSFSIVASVLYFKTSENNYILDAETAIGVAKLVIEENYSVSHIDSISFNAHDTGRTWIVSNSNSVQQESETSKNAGDHIAIFGGVYYLELRKDGKILDLQLWD